MVILPCLYLQTPIYGNRVQQLKVGLASKYEWYYKTRPTSCTHILWSILMNGKMERVIVTPTTILCFESRVSTLLVVWMKCIQCYREVNDLWMLCTSIIWAMVKRLNLISEILSYPENKVNFEKLWVIQCEWGMHRSTVSQLVSNVFQGSLEMTLVAVIHFLNQRINQINITCLFTTVFMQKLKNLENYKSQIILTWT